MALGATFATVRLRRPMDGLSTATVDDLADTVRSFETSRLRIEVGGQAGRLIAQQGSPSSPRSSVSASGWGSSSS